jgi:hypothetical protein
VPIVGPLIGGPISAILCLRCIKPYLPEKAEEQAALGLIHPRSGYVMECAVPASRGALGARHSCRSETAADSGRVGLALRGLGASTGTGAVPVAP